MWQALTEGYSPYRGRSPIVQRGLEKSAEVIVVGATSSATRRRLTTNEGLNIKLGEIR